MSLVIHGDIEAEKGEKGPLQFINMLNFQSAMQKQPCFDLYHLTRPIACFARKEKETIGIREKGQNTVFKISNLPFYLFTLQVGHHAAK